MNTKTLRENEIIRGFGAYILILALFAQALVPTGWMPTKASADGAFTLGICSTDSTQALTFGGNTDPAEQSLDDQRLDQTCPLAGLGTAALPMGDHVAIDLAPSIPTQHPLARDNTSFSVQIGSPLGSRAPPSLI